MTEYVRKPNSFTELELTTVVTEQDVRDFLSFMGSLYVYLRYDENGNPAVLRVVSYNGGNLGTFFFSPGAFLRLEREPYGGFVELTIGGTLASDAGFEAV